MTDNVSNLIVEDLQHLRRGQEQLVLGLQKVQDEVADLKGRITGFEATMGHVMAQITHVQMQVASETGRVDKFEGRLTASSAA